jgi:hypothetical protein
MLSQSEYARRIGVSRSHIHTLIKKKIIPLHEGKIDPTEADQILINHHHPSYDHTRKNTLPFFDESPAPPPGAEAPPVEQELPSTNPAAVPFHQSRAVKEYYLALAAKLEYEEKSGNLVDRKKTEEKGFELYRNFRDTWLNVPAKWAGEGAAALGLDPVEGQALVYNLLDAVVNKTLEEFANGPRQPVNL